MSKAVTVSTFGSNAKASCRGEEPDYQLELVWNTERIFWRTVVVPVNMPISRIRLALLMSANCCKTVAS